MDLIQQVNEKNASNIQRGWWSDRYACFAPPTDLKPILCYPSGYVSGGNRTKTYNSTTTHIPTQDDTSVDEFLMYGECCPHNRNGSTVWQQQRFCGSACFTQEYGTAFGWRDCVAKAVAQKNQELKAAGSNATYNYTGHCEFIDYTTLRISLNQTKWGAASVSASASWALLFGAFVLPIAVGTM